jgi:hypothetical protein
MTDGGFIPGTFPAPDSMASQAEKAAWERKVGRDYANPHVPLRILRHRYSRTDGELEAIAARFRIPARSTEKKGRRAA